MSVKPNPTYKSIGLVDSIRLHLYRAKENKLTRAINLEQTAYMYSCEQCRIRIDERIFWVECLSMIHLHVQFTGPAVLVLRLFTTPALYYMCITLWYRLMQRTSNSTTCTYVSLTRYHLDRTTCSYTCTYVSRSDRHLHVINNLSVNKYTTWTTCRTHEIDKCILLHVNYSYKYTVQHSRSD